MPRCALAACAIGVAVLICGSTAASQVVARNDTTVETALLDVVLLPTQHGVVSAVRVGDRALLPIVPVLDVFEVASRTSAEGAVTFTRPTDGLDVRVDARTHSVQVGRTRRELDERALVSRGGHTLLDAAQLATLLGITMEVEWSGLRVRITRGDSLPPVQRAQRASRWARLLRPPVPEQAPVAYRPLDRPLVDGAMVDYTLSVPTQAPRRDAAFSTSLGADVLGGSLEAFVGGAIDGPRNATGSWLGVWRSNRWLTQLRLGDGLTSGPHPRAVRGFTAGNSPFLRPLEYGTLPMSVRGDSAWEVESYVNGQLVRVDTLRGREASLPLLARYGSNVIDRIAYGPFGEVRRTEQLLSLTPADVLPSGTVEYGFSAGECPTGACSATANFDLRAGLAPRFSARAGMEAESDSSRRVVAAPYVGATLLAPAAVTVSGAVLARGDVSGALRWQPTLDHGAAIEQSHQWHDVPFSDVIRGRVTDRTSASAFARLPWWDHAMQVASTWRDDRAATGRTQDARVSLGMRTPFGQLYPFGELQRVGGITSDDVQHRALGLSVYSLPSRRLGSALEGTWMFATAEWRDDGRRYVTATASRPVGNQLRLDATITAGAGSAPSFGLRAFGDLGVARFISSSTIASNTATTGMHQLQGSAYLDPHRRRVVLERGPLLQRGGVSGLVFLDMNANGRLDADEQPLAGVAVRVGFVSATTDSSGWYLATDVLPFEPVLVQLETATLESPLWVAALERVTLEPTPNSARRLDIPVLPGGVVEGTLFVAGADTLQALSGVEIRLEALESDRTTTTTTFTDGVFAFLGVAPGRYRLRVETPAWSASRADAIEVRAVANGDRVRGIQLRATRR